MYSDNVDDDGGRKTARQSGTSSASTGYSRGSEPQQWEEASTSNDGWQSGQSEGQSVGRGSMATAPFLTRDTVAIAATAPFLTRDTRSYEGVVPPNGGSSGGGGWGGGGGGDGRYGNRSDGRPYAAAGDGAYQTASVARHRGSTAQAAAASPSSPSPSGASGYGGRGERAPRMSEVSDASGYTYASGSTGLSGVSGAPSGGRWGPNNRDGTGRNGGGGGGGSPGGARGSYYNGGSGAGALPTAARAKHKPAMRMRDSAASGDSGGMRDSLAQGLGSLKLESSGGDSISAFMGRQSSHKASNKDKSAKKRDPAQRRYSHLADAAEAAATGDPIAVAFLVGLYTL